MRAPMWDWMTYIGTLGLFTWLLFLFLRFVPMISMFEMRTHHSSREGQEAGGRPLRVTVVCS